MTVFTDTWRFLVQRKLWPVALLLLAAAAAVPMLLAKDPAAPAAPAVAAVKSGDSTLTTEPIVALASEGDRAERRRVLGSAKDPFEPNATPTPTPTPAPVSTPGAAGGVEFPGGSTGGAITTPGSPGGVGGSPVSPGFTSPLAPVTPKRKYQLFELTVRFGNSEDGVQPRRDVKRLQALPSSDEPILIYLGVLEDNKTAVFMVDSGIDAQGDGTCEPSANRCATIHLKEGETEFFDVPADSADGTETTSSAQYQLDVIKIRRTVTTSAKTANRSLARVSKSGRKVLRARIAGDGPLRYRYQARTGKLERLDAKAYKAVVAEAAIAAKAAKAARATTAAKASMAVGTHF